MGQIVRQSAMPAASARSHHAICIICVFQKNAHHIMVRSHQTICSRLSDRTTKNWVRHPLLPTVWSQSDRTVGIKFIKKLFWCEWSIMYRVNGHISTKCYTCYRELLRCYKPINGREDLIRSLSFVKLLSLWPHKMGGFRIRGFIWDQNHMAVAGEWSFSEVRKVTPDRLFYI